MNTVSPDTLCRCDVCGGEERLAFAHGLRYGWPHCHNRPMRIVATDADVPQALDQALDPLIHQVAEALIAIHAAYRSGGK